MTAPCLAQKNGSNFHPQTNQSRLLFPIHITVLTIHDQNLTFNDLILVIWIHIRWLILWSQRFNFLYWHSRIIYLVKSEAPHQMALLSHTVDSGYKCQWFFLKWKLEVWRRTTCQISNWVGQKCKRFLFKKVLVKGNYNNLWNWKIGKLIKNEEI